MYVLGFVLHLAYFATGYLFFLSVGVFKLCLDISFHHFFLYTTIHASRYRVTINRMKIYDLYVQQVKNLLTQLLLAKGIEFIVTVEICPLSVLIRCYAVHFLVSPFIFDVIHLWTHGLVREVGAVTPTIIALIL